MAFLAFLKILYHIAIVVSAFKAYRAQRKARKEADARKGFKLTVKGKATPLPVVYGKAQLGGTMTDVNTRSNYTHAAIASGNQGATEWVFGSSNEQLSSNLSPNNKNEFLTAQYAICEAGVTGQGIQGINHIWLDEVSWNADKFRHGQRIYTYNRGGVACPLATANLENASNHKFNSVAFATGVFRLNRDDPQYYDIPNPSFFVRGLRIRSIVRSGTSPNYTYALSSTYAYSTNPALVLLDYLLADYGKGMSLSDINLESFYNAAQVCDTVVNPASGLGAFNRAGSINNQYIPGTTDIRKDAGETLIRLTNVNGTWPTGSTVVAFDFDGERYRFTASDINGTGDDRTVNLSDITPAMPADTAFGVRRASRFIDYTATNQIAGTLPLYQCNVVLSPRTSVRENINNILDSMEDALLLWSEGQYKLRLDYPANDTEQEALVVANIDRQHIVKDTFSISWPEQNSKYNQAEVSYENENDDFKPAVAIWPPTEDTDTSVYQTYLAQDNNVVLKQNFRIPFATDPHHALARAEQIVRKSRNRVTYKFTLMPEFYRLEPGDLISVTNVEAGLDAQVMRVEEVKIKDDSFNIEVECSKYDYRDLAWNVEDDIAVPYRTFYDFSVTPPTGLTATFDDVERYVNLSWSAGDDELSTIYEYLVEYKLSTETDSEWKTAMTTTNTVGQHRPGDGTQTYQYRIRAKTNAGELSQPTSTVSVNVAGANYALDTGILSFVRDSINVNASGDFINGNAVLSLSIGNSTAQLNGSATTDAALAIGEWRPSIVTAVPSTAFTATNSLANRDSDADTFTVPLSSYVSDGSLSVTVRYRVDASTVVSFTKEINVTRLVAGDRSRTIYLYQNATTAPTAPSDTSGFDSDTGVVEATGSWTTDPTTPSAAQNTYQAQAIITQSNSIGSWSITTSWSSGQWSGNAGDNTPNNKTIVRSGNQPGTIPNPTNNEIGRAPITGDIAVILYSGDGQVSSVRWDGTSWVGITGYTDGGSIANGTIGTNAIADGAVTNVKIDTMAATKLTGTIDSDRLPDGLVYGASTPNDSIITFSSTGDVTASSTFSLNQSADETITLSIGAGKVDTTELADDAVDHDKIASDALFIADSDTGSAPALSAFNGRLFYVTYT